MLASEFAQSSGLSGFFGGQLIELLLRFTLQSMVNTIRALLWPVAVLGFAPPWGLVVLAALYLLFPRYLKKPLERLLFADGPAAADGNGSADAADEQPRR